VILLETGMQQNLTSVFGGHSCSDPDMPADIKAAATGEGSVLLVWRPPLHANGILTKYTIIMKDLSDREVLAMFFFNIYSPLLWSTESS